MNKIDYIKDKNISPKEAKQRRVNIIKNYLLDGGVRDRNIIMFYAKQFDVCESSIYKDFADAKSQLFNENPTFKSNFKNLLSSRLEFLYDTNVDIEDYKEARQNIVTLAKLWGLNEPDELKLTDSEIKFTFGDAKS